MINVANVSTGPTLSGPHPLKLADRLELDRGARLDPANTLGNLSLLLASPETWGVPGVSQKAWEMAQVEAIVALTVGAVTAAVNRSTRPNGSVNVAELTREGFRIQTEWDATHPEEAARISALAEQKRAARQRTNTTNSDRQSR